MQKMPTHQFFQLLLLTAFGFFPLSWSQQVSTNTTNSSITVVPCQSSGIWSEWGNWSSCPLPPLPLASLNVQRRFRACRPQPIGCQPISSFNCSGAYSELRASCPMTMATGIIPQITINGFGGAGFGTSWSASMMQSMQISSQFQIGSLNAGMLQQMQLNSNGTGK